MFVVDFLLKDNKSILKDCNIYKGFKKRQIPIEDGNDIQLRLCDSRYTEVMVQSKYINCTLDIDNIEKYWVHDIETNTDNLISEYLEYV